MSIRSAYPGLRIAAALALGPASLVTIACQDTTGSEAGTFYGTSVNVGDGTARTYVTLDAEGNPAELGIVLTEAALNNLPMTMPGTEHLLALPEKAGATPYRHVTLDWNPHGHEPDHVYTLPHFDAHFYTITNAERLAILPSDPQFQQKAAAFPGTGYVPAGYVAPAPAAVPRMGVHWVDPTSPELNGGTFTRTFLFGSYDGKMIFAEPMLTKAYLETKPNFTQAIPVPEKVTTPGWYPSSYSIKHDAARGEYRISLGTFVQKS